MRLLLLLYVQAFLVSPSLRFLYFSRNDDPKTNFYGRIFSKETKVLVFFSPKWKNFLKNTDKFFREKVTPDPLKRKKEAKVPPNITCLFAEGGGRGGNKIPEAMYFCAGFAAHMRRVAWSWRYPISTHISHKQNKEYWLLVTSVNRSHLDADTVKLDTWSRSDSDGTAALQENLDSPSLGSDADLQLLLQGYPMLPPLSWMTMATMITFPNQSPCISKHASRNPRRMT